MIVPINMQLLDVIQAGLKMLTRRQALQNLVALAAAAVPDTPATAKQDAYRAAAPEHPGATVFRALNGRPEENLLKVLGLLNGIECIVGVDDVVVIKPNVQWWNQGAPNLAVMHALVESIMNRAGGFKGEVVLAENCHRGAAPWMSQSSGWAQPFVRNSDLKEASTYNELGALLKKKFGDRFSVCHWINVAAGAKRVYSPSDQPGYVYCDGTGGVPTLAFSNGVSGEKRRETIMTYPVFRTDRGTIVDLKNGVWANGAYTGQPLKFVNFAALNHHSTYCGMTSTIKNYLGVSDLSGGPDPFSDGKLTAAYYNFHSFPFDKWAPGPKPGMIGAEIGVYLNAVRKADLNIVTAEWVGLASRTDLPAARTRAVLACTDPVALDYHSAKYVLYPNSGIRYHNPGDPACPTHQYLQACARHGGGIFDEREISVRSYDIGAGRFQGADEMIVTGEKEWGRDPKALGKYFLMRYGSFLL
jgi:hypothetical protein